jgi:hypothetical protein
MCKATQLGGRAVCEPHPAKSEVLNSYIHSSPGLTHWEVRTAVRCQAVVHRHHAGAQDSGEDADNAPIAEEDSEAQRGEVPVQCHTAWVG